MTEKATAQQVTRQMFADVFPDAEDAVLDAAASVVVAAAKPEMTAADSTRLRGVLELLSLTEPERVVVPAHASPSLQASSLQLPKAMKAARLPFGTALPVNTADVQQKLAEYSAVVRAISQANAMNIHTVLAAQTAALRNTIDVQKALGAYTPGLSGASGSSVRKVATMKSTSPTVSSTRRSRLSSSAREDLAKKLRRKYDAGASIRALAEETGRSYGFIHRLLSESGVTLRGRRNPKT